MPKPPPPQTGLQLTFAGELLVAQAGFTKDTLLVGVDFEVTSPDFTVLVKDDTGEFEQYAELTKKAVQGAFGLSPEMLGPKVENGFQKAMVDAQVALMQKVEADLLGPAPVVPPADSSPFSVPKGFTLIEDSFLLPGEKEEIVAKYNHALCTKLPVFMVYPATQPQWSSCPTCGLDASAHLHENYCLKWACSACGQKFGSFPEPQSKQFGPAPLCAPCKKQWDADVDKVMALPLLAGFSVTVKK